MIETDPQPAVNAVPNRLNKGIHWEWRGFGKLLKAHRREMEAACAMPLPPTSVTDQYLWTPNSTANVKIRRKRLKFKRLVKRMPGGFELWEEGKHLKYKFPLDQAAIDKLETDLGVRVPENLKSGCGSVDELIAAAPCSRRRQSA